MRPRHDIAHPEADPAEMIHFLRNSNNEWQATAQRLARQRDDIRDAARAFRDIVEDSPWMDDPRGGPDYLDAVNALDTLLGLPPRGDEPQVIEGSCTRWHFAGCGLMAETLYECGGCSAEMLGYTQHECEKQGWIFHAIPGDATRKFIMCDECEKSAARKRRPAIIPPITKHCAECGDEHTITAPPDAVVGTPFKKALPVIVCKRCDKIPDLLRPCVYEAGAFDDPPAFVKRVA